MLDTFEILTTSGVVLWSKTYVSVSPTLINDFIRDVFIEDRVQRTAANPTYKKDGYTLKWKTAKDLGLIFVVWAIITSAICSDLLTLIRRHIKVSFIYPG
jgi:signal recognition particle receptor subunit alpha